MRRLTNLVQVSQTVVIPDGQYNGFQSGYSVTFVADGKRYEAKSDEGLRGLKIPRVVVVENGNVFVRDL